MRKVLVFFALMIGAVVLFPIVAIVQVICRC